MIDNQLTYEKRIEYLRDKKEKQTMDKIKKYKTMDEDDYGYVLPPDDFNFMPEFNDPVNYTFYGEKLWSENFRRLMECHPVYVDPYDALAGRWMIILQRLRPFESVVSNKNLEMAPVFDYSHLKPVHEKYGIIPGIGKMQHFAPDYNIGLSLGWGGLLEKVRKYKSLYGPEKEPFYTAEENVILGICNWISRTVEEIRQMESAEQNPVLKSNLREMAEANEWLIGNPPRNFLEACQWIAWFNMASRTYNRDGAGCQLDTVLWPYYIKDVKEGHLDDEKAKYILACLLLNDTHYYLIGGPDKDGKDITNRLSFLVLEAAHLLKTSVNLTIRVHRGLDERLFNRGLEILLEDKRGYPRFSGDDSLVNGFIKHGYPIELARQRVAVGCNWTSLPGVEYTLNDLIKINFAKVFEAAFYEYTGNEGCKSVEGLYDIFKYHLEKAVECVAEGIDFHLKYQHMNAPELLLNLLSHGPIEKGLDASNGGVDYYNIGVDGCALATVADSFAALEQRIEREGVLTWQECEKVLKSNFEGIEGEKIRHMLLKSEKFGQGNSLGDRWAKRISLLFTDTVISKRTPGGRLMIPGLFSWANTVSLGKQVGATPNGRLALTPISHGANPDPGFRKDGALTAMAKAIASVQPGYGNTAPFQLELNSTIINDENAVEKIGAVIKTHFELGGTLVNINVVDAEKLKEAYKDPNKYPNLVVRVTGFTAYFVALSREFQEMVIKRIIND